MTLSPPGQDLSSLPQTLSASPALPAMLKMSLFTTSSLVNRQFLGRADAHVRSNTMIGQNCSSSKPSTYPAFQENRPSQLMSATNPMQLKTVTSTALSAQTSSSLAPTSQTQLRVPAKFLGLGMGQRMSVARPNPNLKSLTKMKATVMDEPATKQ